MKLTEENIKAELKFLNAMQAKIRNSNVRKQRSDRGTERETYDFQKDRLYISYMRRAHSKGFEFELEEDMFINIKTHQCIYCGGIPTGFDRVDNSIGYTLENAKPCCGKCNMMKHVKGVDDFLSHIKLIYNYSIKPRG
jgi:hypothetical protein